MTEKKQATALKPRKTPWKATLVLPGDTTDKALGQAASHCLAMAFEFTLLDRLEAEGRSLGLVSNDQPTHDLLRDFRSSCLIKAVRKNGWTYRSNHKTLHCFLSRKA